jgi:hypothetical protein
MKPSNSASRELDAHPFRRQQIELVMKKYGVPAVTDHYAAVVKFPEETMRHGGKPRRRILRGAVHALGGVSLQNLDITDMTVLQMNQHEARHVRNRCRAAARRSGHNQLIRAGRR